MTKKRFAIGFALASVVLAASVYNGEVIAAGCGWNFYSTGDPGCTDPLPLSPCTAASNGATEEICPAVGMNWLWYQCSCTY